MSRVSRRLQQIGIALAVPPVLLAVWLAVHETSYEWGPHPWDKNPIIAPVHNGRMLGTFTDEIALFVVAALIYAASCAVAWTVDRLTRSNRP